MVFLRQQNLLKRFLRMCISYQHQALGRDPRLNTKPKLIETFYFDMNEAAPSTDLV